MSPQKIQGPGTAIKFLGVIWLGKTCSRSLEHVSKNLKEVQTFVGVLGVGRTFIPHMALWLCPFYGLIKKKKKGTCVGLGDKGNKVSKSPLRRQKY